MNASFEQLLLMYQPRVFAAARGWVCDEQQAQELAQETLAKAWAARERYDFSRPFYPWLYTILRNLIRNAAHRAQKLGPHDANTEKVATTQRSPFGLASQRQQQQALDSALGALSEEQREIINLRHFQDLSYAEIGQILGVPMGTVMSRLYRARQALCERLNREA